MRQKFERDGHFLYKNLIPLIVLDNIQKKMLDVMRNYSDLNDIDLSFKEITGISKKLRGNVYKVFGRFSNLPEILFINSVKQVIKNLGYSDFTIQGYSILVMEPNEEKFLFHPHQDLKDRLGREALILWIPLSVGKDIGGLGVANGSHKMGPTKHSLGKTGHLNVDCNIKDFVCEDIVDFNLGDCVFFSPYLIHWSIKNLGDNCRWTAVVKIDSLSNIDWLEKNLNPFDVSKYIDERSNEERLGEFENGY